MSALPFLLEFQPGVQRDGTRLDANRCVDSLWCRWRLGKARKMGGYRSITDRLLGRPRRLHCFYQNGMIIAHVGTTSGIQQVIFDSTGNLISIADRTPAVFAAGANVGFTMDAIFDTTSNVVQLVAHAVPNTADISSSISAVPFIGQIDQASRLELFGNPTASSGVWIEPSIAGGIVCVQPFVFAFDKDGLVQWSSPNLPLYLGVTGGSSGAGQARISAQKIVAGAPLRGGGAQSPAALFWSLSEVITASYIGAPAYFAFNTISPSSSILSSAGVVEYDGLYFWPGTDRWLVFNGTVSEVPNPQNQDWFFSNLTPGYEARTYGFKVPRYGEIWWCAAMFGSTEPNHAVILNVRENTWYDTALPAGGRGTGYYAQGFRYPLMAGGDAVANGYRLWLHEIGTDEVDGASVKPVRSYFETPWFGGPKDTPPNDKGLSFQLIEPDIQQTGDMTMQLIGAANARSPENAGPVMPLRQVPGVPQEQMIGFKPTAAHRLTRLHVESNVLGGDYVCGRMIAHGQPSDGRMVT